MRSLILALVLLTGCVNASGEAEPGWRSEIETMFARHRDGPGYVIGVVRGGALVFAEGFGYANLEERIPLTPDTAMNLASLSKQFTAAAVALEVQAGHINLDDRMAEHWPNLPPFMQRITVAHLVYMTSGLPEYYDLPPPGRGWGPEDGFTVQDAIGAVQDAGALQFEPGSAWAYSNANYQFLAELVARLNGRSFADQMQARVFGPLGMTDSWIDAPVDLARSQRASAYVRDDQGWRIARRVSPHYGGSGMFASVRDLARWDAALYSQDAFGSGFEDLMLSTRQFSHDKVNDAFGLVHGEHRGLATIWYEGGDHGVSTYMVRMPARDETVICLSNIGGGDCAGKARAVIDILLEAHA